MKKLLAFIGSGLIVVVLSAGVLAFNATPSCACGEIPGTAKYHWHEMTVLERARYHYDSYVPFDETGKRS